MIKTATYKNSRVHVQCQDYLDVEYGNEEIYDSSSVGDSGFGMGDLSSNFCPALKLVGWQVTIFSA